jgi:PAS domain S-box-containing protein
METTINLTDSMLFDEVPCYISIQDRDFKIIKTNRRFRETFGDRIGEYCYVVYKMREDKCPVCPMDKTFSDGKIFESEELVFSPEGYPVYVNAQTAPIYDDKGNIVAAIEMATDITESKKLQRRLEESIEKYRMLYNVVPCFISVQNKDFIVIDANQKFKDEFGDYRNKYCYYLYKKRDSRCEICPVAETFEDGKIHTSEEIVAGKDGVPINILVVAAPIKNESGEISAVMEMTTDITDIKRIQSQMANVGQLVANLAHTIKGIISGLDGGMYVVESGFRQNKDEIIKKGWEMVQRNVDRVSHLVLDILYYAKDRVPEKQEIYLDKVCEEIVELYSKKLNDLNIEVKLDLRFSDCFFGDSKAIYTLILNLVENAIDACKWDSDKSKHTIEILLSYYDSYIYLTIIDNGHGMSEDVKSKLFTPLYSTKGSSGSGFGLMVVKKIVDEHNGLIKVESEIGKGSKFIIKLPLSKL